MARTTTFGPVNHLSDAGFRAWVAEIISLLIAAGLVQTSDTGQIDTATVVRPGASVTAGYAIFRFDDALQATRPVYIKFGFGTGGGTTSPRTTLQVGTGTNGAGTLTGNVTAEIICQGNNGWGTGNYTSYAIHKGGYAMLAFKVGAFTSNTVPSFVIQRTVDNTGEDTDEGLMIITQSSGASQNIQAQCARMRFAPHNDNFAENGFSIGFIPGGITDSRVALSPQIFPHWIALPKQRPLLRSAGCIRGEVGTGAEFSMVLVGAVARNYIGLGSSVGRVLNSIAQATNSDLIALWED